MQILANCDVYTGENVVTDRALVLSGGKVVDLVSLDQISGSAVIDMHGLSVAAGFIDLQVNGGGDVLFNQEPSVEGLECIVRAHRRFGTTHLLPTFITGSENGMRNATVAVRSYFSQGKKGILGIHYEGPFLSPSKAGVHDISYMQSSINSTFFETLLLNSNGVVMVTLAPEIVPLGDIAKLADMGVRVAIGHSAADGATCLAAIRAGASCATHLYNAMSALTSREPGVVGAFLASDNVWVDFIADGHHVDFTSLRAAVNAKPKGKSFVVTDAMPPVGGSAGGYELGPYKVKVVQGKCVTDDGVLAGSALDMATAVRNCIQKMSVPKDEALRMASTYPAQYIGVDGQYGALLPGYSASLAVFDNELNVFRTMIDGEWMVGN
jgi:N-acetylglucosamine-6-phosphate deacetylase